MSDDLQQQQPMNGRYDVVTARILVSGLVSTGLACIFGIVLCESLARPVPAILGHLASMTAGAMAMGFTALFKGNGKG